MLYTEKIEIQMKRNILFLMAILLPLMGLAQTSETLDPEFGGRIAFNLDKKIVKGLHLSIEEEVRMDENFTALNRLQSNLMVKYKVHKNVKLGAGYALINGYSSSKSSFKGIRHRVMFDAKGTLKLGQWNLSLKERLQVTRRTGDYNVYQNPRNAITLKSRVTVKYVGLDRMEPYAFFELRNYLNAPVIYAAYDGSSYLTLDDYSESGPAGWFLNGFNGGYINRYRGCIGTDIKFDKHNTLSLYLMADYVTDKEVDANAEGTKLKKYAKETGMKGWMGAGYEYSF